VPLSVYSTEVRLNLEVQVLQDQQVLQVVMELQALLPVDFS
jgi:hypothetical protein